MTSSIFGKLKGLFRKEQPRIYLGHISVVPRSRLLEFFESRIWDYPRDLDDHMRNALEELFAFPPALSRDGSREDDLLLELMVPDYRQGSAFCLPSDWHLLPIFWRPKVTVAARLVHMESGKTRFSCKFTEVLPWTKIGRGFFMKEVCGTAEINELKILAYKASTKVLLAIKDHLK